MRHLLGKAVITFAFAAIASFGADNSFGIWKLNPEKSKYTPEPMPVKNLTVTREAADGGGVKVTITGEQADGTPINATYTARYDGIDVWVTGNTPYNIVALKQRNANTFTDERKKSSGPYKASGRTAISDSGKIMTTTTKGTNADGKQFTSVFVFEKQQ